MMSQLSTVTDSRKQWQHQAAQRGDRDRSQRTQRARISAERARGTNALKEAQARLRQLAAHLQRRVALPQGDLVWLALQLLCVVRIGWRAVSRVLSLLAWAGGLTQAPCPQTGIHGVIRLAIVRIEAARGRTGWRAPRSA